MTLGKRLQKLREESKLSQSDLAGRLKFTASRISRLESGDIYLDPEEASAIAKAIGTDKADSLTSYLSQEWSVLDVPAFEHPNSNDLWKAEQALQRLNELKKDPELKNVFLKQVELCEEELRRAAGFLYSTEHSIAFMGSLGVGKTTAVCSLTDVLRDKKEKDLNRQMGLQTGSGRTTICEVHIRRGGEYAISIEPCSEEELNYHISDFCDFLLNLASDDLGNKQKGGSSISAEIVRTLRNLSGLTIKKHKLPDGKFKTEDPALDLVKQYPKKEELTVELLSRYNAPKRKRTSISYPSMTSIPAIKWISKTFREINFGHHSEFSLPKRIEVSIPSKVLDSDNLNIRLIDTRGIDEESAPRRDLQSYLDDDRTLVVFCSGFNDAPNAAVQKLIERAIDGGLRDSIISRGRLLILPKGGEEAAVLSDFTGEPVSDWDEGREIRLDQVRTTTMTSLNVQKMHIEFLNVQSEQDCSQIRSFMLNSVIDLRDKMAVQIDLLSDRVDYLIRNKADEQSRAVFEKAINPLRIWLTSNGTLKGQMHRADKALLADMDQLRYASSLRASVNRRGNWHNFDYWHSLGYGVRCDVVAHSKEQFTKLEGIIENSLNDPDLEEMHEFLRQYLIKIKEASTFLFVDVEQLGETMFAEPLRAEYEYWRDCQSRWGGGPGYKSDIRNWTYGWFEDGSRSTMHEFLVKEIQLRWGQLIGSLLNYLETDSSNSENEV